MLVGDSAGLWAGDRLMCVSYIADGVPDSCRDLVPITMDQDTFDRPHEEEESMDNVNPLYDLLATKKPMSRCDVTTVERLAAGLEQRQQDAALFTQLFANTLRRPGYTADSPRIGVLRDLTTHECVRDEVIARDYPSYGLGEVIVLRSS